MRRDDLEWFRSCTVTIPNGFILAGDGIGPEVPVQALTRLFRRVL